jgi:hypothetical protein
MEREKQIVNIKEKCQRRMTRETESIEVPVCGRFLRSSVEFLVMRREKCIQWIEFIVDSIKEAIIK